MNRDVLLIYLRDLRDLEIAKQKLALKIRKEDAAYQRQAQGVTAEIKKLKTPRYMKDPEEDSPGTGILLLFLFGIIMAMITIAICCTLFSEGIRSDEIGIAIFDIAFPAALSVASFLIARAISPHRKYIAEKRKIDEYNAKEKNRVEVVDAPRIQAREKILQQINSEYYKRRNSLTKDYNACSKLLADTYSVNIVPSQYRDLKHIYFLYNFMSTSNLSFEQAILQGMLDDRFDRIEAKLDHMIEQNEELIFHTRCVEANTREIAEKQTQILENNQRMLESQERTEENTLAAAQNAKIAANYAEINAFFATANYLDRQR